MLETVREYSLQKLREQRGTSAGEEEAAARSRHLAYFLHLAEAIAPEWSGSEPEAALSRVEREIGNFQAALAWVQTRDAPEDASLRLAAALWPYWEMRGSLSEGRE